MTQPQLPAWLKTVHHDGSPKYVSNMYPAVGETIQIRLRTGRHAPVRRVLLRTFPDGEAYLTSLRETEQDSVCQWWEGDLLVGEPTVHYRFVLDAEDGIWFYSANGAGYHIPLDNTDFRILGDYIAPDWLHTAVFYQIFPDRFANGDPGNDPGPDDMQFKGVPAKTYPWGSAPDPAQPFPIVFYGGDLQGIIAKLDYLADLGVNALYLNPIFTARSNHKYDVTDYMAVDPTLGGDNALVALREALTARSMRYILDVVPNHCGYWHPWFQAALRDVTAEEAGFFTFEQHPDQYATWLGVWTLPKLNYQNGELRRRIFEGEQALFRHWLRAPFAADGWRVDVANMLARQGPSQLGAEVARGIRTAVKTDWPNTYLMGENFFDASPQLQGDQWDGVMNYTGLTLPFWYWLNGYTQWVHDLSEHIVSPVKWSTYALIETWENRRAAIPWVIALQQYNLLGSHDTSRIRSIVGGNDALHRLALIVLFTFPGVPGLYYGDEIGMVDDPALHSRGCMPWDPAAWDHDLLAFHKRLIALRKESEALRNGGFELLLCEEDAFAFQRESVTDRVLVVAHRSEVPRNTAVLRVDHAGIPDGAVLENALTGERAVVKHGHVDLGSWNQGGMIWRQVR